MTVTMYAYDRQGLEDFADAIKRVVVGKLVHEGLLDEDVADEWCAHHTVIGRKKTIFRTLCKRWEDVEKAEGYYWIVVEG